MNENYKKQIIDCIDDLVDSKLKDKIFEDAYLLIAKNEAFDLMGISKKDLNLSPPLKNKLLLLSRNQNENFQIIHDKIVPEEIKKEILNNETQTEPIDIFQKLNIYLLEKKQAFKQEILKIENLNIKQKEEFSLISKIAKKKPEIKIVKRNRFDNSELRLINSYCSPSTHFHIKSNDLTTTNFIKSKSRNYDSANTNLINQENKRKKSNRSLGDVNILKLNNNFSKNKNSYSKNITNPNNHDNRSHIGSTQKQINRNLDINSTFADKSNDISNNPGYMLCESVNNIYIDTNNHNDSSLDKTNNYNKANFTLSNSIEKNININNKIIKTNKESVKVNMHKINILENIYSDCEDDENKIEIDKYNRNFKIELISIGIQTENETFNSNTNANRTLKGLSNLNIDLNENLNSNIKKNTPKYANLYAPFSNKNSQVTKKKEELKIIIESYFSINSYKVNESLIIKPKSNTNVLGPILSPTRTIINSQPNNFNSNNTNINLNNDLETYNNLNSSLSTNIYNNNFHNYSRYLASGLSGNLHDKVVSSSVLTGANNYNNLNHNLDYNNHNLNHQIENIVISEKNYEIKNEINFFYRKITNYNENEIQTDMLNVKFFLI